ncbi:MAG TPA: GNAT family N-acetyltransferase [Candidatus Polarisedimenticolia bacterium]|nr:GNAT family N-acetyltransferase [Candidatus Polarisedimenticolia bacterium]
MQSAAHTPSALLRLLPDGPIHVEARALLLSGRCRVEAAPDPARGFVVGALDAPLVCVAGMPPAGAIRRAVQRARAVSAAGAPPPALPVDVICGIAAADHLAGVLPGWVCEKAVIHALPGAAGAGRRHRPDVRGAQVRLLAQDEAGLLSHLPGPLCAEMAREIRARPIAAAFAGGRAAACCAASWLTESLGDVSIETLEEHRGRGLATACADLMIDTMRRSGREPVWGAFVSNTASLRLAAKLGFEPVGELAVFRPAS